VISVAKRKSLFDDNSEEIQRLTFVIKEDINALNQDIARVSHKMILELLEVV